MQPMVLDEDLIERCENKAYAVPEAKLEIIHAVAAYRFGVRDHNYALDHRDEKQLGFIQRFDDKGCYQGRTPITVEEELRRTATQVKWAKWWLCKFLECGSPVEGA